MTTTGPVHILLRIEGIAIGLAAIAVFAGSGASWWLFAALVLVPDVAMLGYLVSKSTGAAAYNAAHTYSAPALIGAGLWAAGSPLALPIAAIWVAHIGLDRAAGYGLKYCAGFKITHLNA